MTEFRYFRDFGLATNDDGSHVIKIDKTCFVVDGDTVQEVGTNLHYDPVTDRSFQLLADGRRVSALSYEAFGTYPRAFENHSRWMRYAYRAAKFFMHMHELPWYDRAVELGCAVDVFMRFFGDEAIGRALEKYVSRFPEVQS